MPKYLDNVGQKLIDWLETNSVIFIAWIGTRIPWFATIITRQPALLKFVPNYVYVECEWLFTSLYILKYQVVKEISG